MATISGLAFCVYNVYKLFVFSTKPETETETQVPKYPASQKLTRQR